MDVTALVESNRLTVALVKDSPSKQLVVLSAGSMMRNQEGKDRLTLMVEIDAKRKDWQPNKESLKAIVPKYGAETNSWIGKVLKLEVKQLGTREGVVATPV